MSVGLRLTPAEYDRMIQNGAFEGIHRRIELIRGELREISPAGPLHEDYIDYLNRWSNQVTTAEDCVVRTQSSIDLNDSRLNPMSLGSNPGGTRVGVRKLMMFCCLSKLRIPVYPAT